MTYAHRIHLANKAAAAKPRSFDREHTINELKALTTKQIRRECRWGWLRKYKPSERTVQMIGLATGSALYVGGMLGYVLVGMAK